MAETGKESVVENVLETTYKEEENSKQIRTKEIIMNIEPFAAWQHWKYSFCYDKMAFEMAPKTSL